MPLHLSDIYTGFLRLFFRFLYHEFAWTYDFVAALVSVGLWSHWVAQAAPLVKGSRVLELGHGPGHLQILLQERGLTPIGLDKSPQMGRLAHQRLMRYFAKLNSSHNGYAHCARLVRGDGSSLPFPPASFDTIVATFPTEYIFASITLAEIFRILSPGGRLVILFTAQITGKRFLERAANLLFNITGQAGEASAVWLHAFHRAGFSAQVRWIELETSRLLVLEADKPQENRSKAPLLM